MLQLGWGFRRDNTLVGPQATLPLRWEIEDFAAAIGDELRTSRATGRSCRS